MIKTTADLTHNQIEGFVNSYALDVVPNIDLAISRIKSADLVFEIVPCYSGSEGITILSDNDNNYCLPQREIDRLIYG